MGFQTKWKDARLGFVTIHGAGHEVTGSYGRFNDLLFNIAMGSYIIRYLLIGRVLL